MADRTKARVDSAERVVCASPRDVYAALTDPQRLAQWLPPDGMRCRIDVFEPRAGGRYRMMLQYLAPPPGGAKTTADADVVAGRFVELVPGERVVQEVAFASDDPAFAGTMTMTWTLTPVAGGTRVWIRCENVPPGIRKEDHDAGLASSLAHLDAHLAAG